MAKDGTSYSHLQFASTTMWLLLIIGITTAVVPDSDQQSSPAPPRKCSTCIKVGDMCHNVSYIFDLEAPYRSEIVITKLGVWRSRNFLLYAFEPNITDPEYSKVAYVNLDNPKVTQILSNGKMSNFRTFDVDQDHNIVYLGGGDAIWTLDTNNRAIFYSSRGDTIKALFYKNNVFFVRERELRIVEKRDELFKPYEQYSSVKNFVINKYNILVFLNSTGLYASRFNTDKTVLLSKNNFFRGLALDLDGIAYAWWVDGIYKVLIDPDFENSRVVKIADIPDIGALTFDNDNQLIFTSSNHLFRLVDTGLLANSTAC